MDPLDVRAHDLHVVDGAARFVVSGLDLPLGEDQHLIGDVNAEVVVLGVGAGQLGDKAALAAAQLKDKGLFGPGVLGTPLAAPDKGIVDMKIAGHQLSAGIGLETHSHNSWFSFKNFSTSSGAAAQLP